MLRLLPALFVFSALAHGSEGAGKSHEQMIAALDIVESQIETTNYFLGKTELRRAQARIASLPPIAKTRERFNALVDLGVQELRSGLLEEAIIHLNKALAIVVSSNQSGGNQFDIVEVVELVGSLAIANFRLGETENCCAGPNPEACIFPLETSALHTQRRGSENAILHLSRLLMGSQQAPAARAQAIWLLNLAHMTLGQHPEAVPEQWRIPLPHVGETSNTAFPEFPNIAPAAGVNTFSLAGGAIADDFDGDGWIDLVVSSWDPAVEMIFFHNRTDGTFEKMDANFAGIRGGNNLRQVDFDNDGDLDIYVLRGGWMGANGAHPNSLLANDGTGRFTDVTFAMGLAEPAFPTQTAEWADYDLDGDLDLFVGNESNAGRLAPCQLFRNDGDTFTDIAPEAGLDFTAFVKAVNWGDYDNDRYPDLIISDLQGPNRLYRNQGDGTFVDRSAILGDRGPERSFPAWFFDENNDGFLDIFLSSYQAAGLELITYLEGEELPDDRICAVLRNVNGESFRNVTREIGLDVPMLPMGSNFGDLTNNGHPDIYLGTGTPNYDAIIPNGLYVHNGAGYDDVTIPSRMGHLQKGHAVSFADFDQDGDLDVFEQMGGAYRGDGFYDVLFENPGFGRNWLSIRLKGTASNRSGIGARVSALLGEGTDDERWVHQWMSSGSSFGANPLALHLGLAEAESVDRLEIFWPVTGKTQTMRDVAANQRLVIEED